MIPDGNRSLLIFRVKAFVKIPSQIRHLYLSMNLYYVRMYFIHDASVISQSQNTNVEMGNLRYVVMQTKWKFSEISFYVLSCSMSVCISFKGYQVSVISRKRNTYVLTKCPRDVVMQTKWKFSKTSMLGDIQRLTISYSICNLVFFVYFF